MDYPSVTFGDTSPDKGRLWCGRWKRLFLRKAGGKGGCLRQTDYPSVTFGDTSPDKGGAMGALPGADEAT